MKKPILYIIPRIHKLNNCLFIQWIGKKYYIKKNAFKRFFNLYTFIDYLLIMLICIITGIFPFNNIIDVVKAIIICIIIGIMEGFAIVGFIENDND